MCIYINAEYWPDHSFKGPLLGRRLVLRTESPLKMMKNAFYFMLKALFVLEIFTFLSWLFGYIREIAWQESYGLVQNLWRHRLGNKNNYIRIFFIKILHFLHSSLQFLNNTRFSFWIIIIWWNTSIETVQRFILMQMKTSHRKFWYWRFDTISFHPRSALYRKY